MSDVSDSGQSPPWVLPFLLIVAVLAIVAAGGTALAADPADGHDHGAHDHGDHASVLDHNGRFTGPGDEWPPQPKGAKNEKALPVDDIDGNVDEIEAVKAALEDAEVVAELGDRFEASATDLADLHDKPSDDGKSDGKADNEVTVVHFSYSENQTVRTTMTDGEVTSVETIPASEEQPPLTPDEQDWAIDIARAWWQAEGNDRVDDLQGFSIRAFQADGSYHPVRMVYVSFHESADHAPELLTNVDLTNEIVSKGWLDQ